MRCILHVDMDAFFAAIEVLRHPQLRGRPLVIGGRGDPHARGVVSTASYEARRFGIHSGMPLRTAYRRCPEAVFLPVDFPEYLRVSERIKAILRTFSPVMEDVGIDEAFLDLSGTHEAPLDVARAIKQRIREETGLTCSIGIAPNKLLAKLASDLEKPDGVVVLREGDVPRKVWPLPVRRLWGVGPKTQARLAELGVSTIGQLAAVAEPVLIEHFGPAHGSYLHHAAQGIDARSLITEWEPKSLSREHTFERDTDRWPDVETVLRTLSKELVARMREQGYRAGSVSVKLRYANFETHTHAVRLPAPTDDVDVIGDAALQCLRESALPKKLRLVGVRVGDLSGRS